MLTFFYCLHVVRIQVFIGGGCQPISVVLVLLRRRLVFLLYSLPLLLFSSWLAPLMLLCGPGGAAQTQLVLLLSSWWVRLVLLPSSFCPPLSSSRPPLVFLLSWRCRAAYAVFPRRGWGCGRSPPPQQQQFLPTKILGIYAGKCVARCSQADTTNSVGIQGVDAER